MIIISMSQEVCLCLCRKKYVQENHYKLKPATSSYLRALVWGNKKWSWLLGVFPNVCLGAQLCLTLGDPMDCSQPGSSVHEILPARILEWVAISSSKGSSWPRYQTHGSCISCIDRWILYYLGSFPKAKSQKIVTIQKRSTLYFLKGKGKYLSWIGGKKKIPGFP